MTHYKFPLLLLLLLLLLSKRVACVTTVQKFANRLNEFLGLKV